MVRRILIANRGEIAVRVIRTCRELGIETVAVYSTADRDSLHVQLADQAVCIGPPPSAKSYLVKENLIMAALRTGCQAIHPGVGFLSENADFARAVQKEGLIFIGPDPEVIDLLGDKVQARNTAKKYGLPITPGTEGAVQDPVEAAKIARELGYPVIIKAAAGGGGKGMRVIRREEELAENLAIASREAAANFADGTVFIEKYLENPRHVELQIVADGKGTVLVLGERDCSVQKRHQKLIEESPSPAVDEDMRRRMSEGAVRMFRELKYRGAGTIEFLVSGKDFYFMEVNARIQVEHPVSEFVTGIDIIRQQILACTEGRMEIDPETVRLSGWSIECRINALSPGKVHRLDVPGGPGVRFDSFLYSGCTVPPHYDSMVAKLIVYAPTRPLALARMDRALRELRIEGIKTNAAQQRWIINHPKFQSGDFGTGYYAEIEKEVEHVH
ncbi:MAG TPA: acetyl-CoA carboxylase biotin carboxylase subunit [Termitinemataceae bacterium]|nr:acetyl-CoA carboxylase biotin carboxylase subunit [Termitinemataceae bacterium]HOM23758.1 acetyl-CoA carboxylase biotin carboxylase subunit [Termitinemataceae bacterium]HPQ00797.1 acetyl-CoA carboxylase biotin carboxylase subunit [Termitinemataceae bacterium]